VLVSSLLTAMTCTSGQLKCYAWRAIAVEDQTGLKQNLDSRNISEPDLVLAHFLLTHSSVGSEFLANGIPEFTVSSPAISL